MRQAESSMTPARQGPRAPCQLEEATENRPSPFSLPIKIFGVHVSQRDLRWEIEEPLGWTAGVCQVE